MVSSKFKRAAAAAAFLFGAAMAGSSNAAIYIGLQEAGVDGDDAGLACVTGGICTKASGANFAVFNAAYGTFELELLTGTEGVSPTLLGSTTSDHNIRGSGGTLNVYITRTGLTGKLPKTVVSSFTSNVLPKKWSVVESTYLSTTNQLYTGTLLSSHAFSAIGTFEHENDIFGGASGPYSVTTRYTLTAPTTGSAFSTISIRDASVPEPATWALMITGFGGAGAALRSRRRAAVQVRA